MATQYWANRIETPERWAKALARAIENGFEPLLIAVSGEWVVTSTTEISAVYRTNGRICECEAGIGANAIRQHRAVVRQILGRFDRPQPTMATVECGQYHGCGWPYVEVDGSRSFADKVACGRCGGTGRMPVRQPPTLVEPMTLTAD